MDLIAAKTFAENEAINEAAAGAVSTSHGISQTVGSGPGASANGRSPGGNISPDMAKGIAIASPIITNAMAGLLSGKGLSGLGSMISLGGMMGMAAQFLPPWAGDAMAVGMGLATGGLAGAADALLSKFLPPEVKAVYDAIKNLPGGWPEFLKWLTENPVTPQGVPGPWAARLTDIATCPGGIGPITTPCLPTLLIGGMPAARRTDIVICNGLPVDAITVGEPTVVAGGLFAARREDDTAHLGKVTTGWPTVHIGKKRSISDMRAADEKAKSCLTAAAGSGAATIAGSGITGAFGGLGDILEGVAEKAGQMAMDKLKGMAESKINEALSDALGGDDKGDVPPQPPVDDVE